MAFTKITKNTNLANFLINVFFHKKYQITIFIYLYICIWFDVENIGCIWMKLIYHPLYFVLLHYLWQNKIRFLLWLSVNLDDLYFHALIKKKIKNKQAYLYPVPFLTQLQSHFAYNFQHQSIYVSNSTCKKTKQNKTKSM